MKTARRRSGMPRERRFAGWVPAVTGAAAMALEGGQRLGDLGGGRLHGVSCADLAGEGGVDVVVDRLRDLRIDRADRACLGLRDGLLELGRERVLLLDRRGVIGRGGRAR